MSRAPNHPGTGRRCEGRPPADADPVAAALVAKARAGAPGSAQDRVVAAGEDWRVADVVCTCGPSDRAFEERHASASISLVLSGTFVCRSEHGSALFSPGSLMLVRPGQAFECSHTHGEGDRCLSFQFGAQLFERLAHDAGVSRPAFVSHRLPLLRTLSRLTARARTVLGAPAAVEEIAFELAGTVVEVAAQARYEPPSTTRHHARIARVLRQMGARSEAPYTLAGLARGFCVQPPAAAARPRAPDGARQDGSGEPRGAGGDRLRAGWRRRRGRRPRAP